MKKKQFVAVILELEGSGIENTEQISHFLGQVYPVGHDGQVIGSAKVYTFDNEDIVTAID